jgi:hypothetical protein
MLMIALAVLSSPAGAETWDFEKDQVDGPPKGFYFDVTRRGPKAKWRVVQDGDNRVLAQLDTSRQRRRYALAVVEDLKFKDVKLKAKIKVAAGNGEPTGGVVWRYKNSENYLVARLDFSDNRVRLYRVVNGNRVMFGRGDKLPLRADQWYTLRVEHKDNKIKVYLDDEVLIVEKDRHFRNAGKVGLWTQADAETYFDDFFVEGLERRD